MCKNKTNKTKKKTDKNSNSNSKKENHNKVKLSFIGGNSNNVTGSCIVGSFKGFNFLLELGMVQGFSKFENYKENWNILNKIDFNNIDVIFVNHFHIDHSGLLSHIGTLPNFKGKVICTTETARMLKPLLEDSARIIEDDCEWLKKSRGINAIEYYKKVHIYNTLDYVREYSLNETHKLNNFISFKLIPNNHVLGSSSLEMYLKDDLGKTHTLFYSSDLGNTVVDKFFVYDNIKYAKKANVAIFESTYGSDRKKTITSKMRKNDIREMKNQMIYTLLEKKGKVIFPSFACDRQENLLVYIKQIIDGDERLKDINVVVDGKLSSKVIDVYSEVLEGEQKELFDSIRNWKNLKINSDYEQTRACLMDNTPQILLSSSGMCEAGRIKEYLKKNLPDNKNTILFTGFAPENSIGGKIKSQLQNTIKIDETTCDIRADIVCLNSFSSHMQKEQILDYCLNMNVSDKYIFTHGEKEGKENIVRELRDELAVHNKTTQVVGSKMGMVVYF